LLAAHRRTADAAGIEWKSAIYAQIQEEGRCPQKLTVARMTKLGRVSRAGFYRFGSEDTSGDPDMKLRDAIQRIALQWPSYGRLRITAELKRRGWEVNHKRVRRIMREDNLLCLRRRKFVATTDSSHGYTVYPHLAADLKPAGIDQLWVADITYIRLEQEFVYLAVVLDAFSRRVIGWALERTLEARLAVSALQMALKRRRPGSGLVHHSDRGVQYACSEYTELLKAHGIRISMSRKGNPYDNAYCESFMKTLKYEEVYTSEYRDLAEARAQIGAFLEKVYNSKRLHSALGYLPPVEFERSLLAQTNAEAAVPKLTA
jgi:transposase InsO family protein